MDLFQNLFDQHKVYIVPGSEFGSKKFGWFRITFAVGSKKLEVAMERIEKALASYKRHVTTVSEKANHLGISLDKKVADGIVTDEMMNSHKKRSGMKACFYAVLNACGCKCSKTYNVTEIIIE